MKYVFQSLVVLVSVGMQCATAQVQKNWNGKKCAVVLTYDDALNIHLDSVIPALNEYHLKGTFYLIGDSPVVSSRLVEWRTAAKKGHELGNHTMHHPCDSEGEGRSWVQPEQDLSTYSVERAVNEIRITNTLLKTIDGKDERTFAFPCGDMQIGSVNFYDYLQNDFVGARGVVAKKSKLQDVNLNDIDSFVINGESGANLISLVQDAMKTNTLVVFLFHGVGGEHSLNVSKTAHHELLAFLASHKKDIWVAPLVEVAKYIKLNQIKK